MAKKIMLILVFRITLGNCQMILYLLPCLDLRRGLIVVSFNHRVRVLGVGVVRRELDFCLW